MSSADPPDDTYPAPHDVAAVVGRRVRELRNGMGVTMERFAASAGLSIGMLSKIEHGKTSPSLGTLSAVAGAAGVPLTSLFRGLEEEQDAVVVRAGGGIEIDHAASGKGRRYQDLGSLRGPTREIEPLMVTITEPDETFPLFQHGGVEFLHMIAGRMAYGYGSKRYVLNPGDTMQLHGEVPHGPTGLLELPVQFLTIKVHGAVTN